MSLEAWRVTGKERLLSIPPWLEVLRETLQLPDGRRIDDFYTVQLPAYAVIVALTTDGRLVAERHYRPGARQVTMTLPSGFLEVDEDPVSGGKRELLEETGFSAPDWTSLGRFVVDGNRGCGSAHLLLAQRATRSGIPDGKDLAEIAVELVAPEDFLHAIQSGGALELASAAALALALLRLAR